MAAHAPGWSLLSGSYGDTEIAREYVFPTHVPEWTGNRHYEAMHFCSLRILQSSHPPARLSRLSTALHSSPADRLHLSFDDEKKALKRLDEVREEIRKEEGLREERKLSKEAALEWEQSAPDASPASRKRQEESRQQAEENRKEAENEKKISEVMQITGSNRGQAVFFLTEKDWDTAAACQFFFDQKESERQTEDVTLAITMPAGNEVSTTMTLDKTAWDLKSYIYQHMTDK